MNNQELKSQMNSFKLVLNQLRERPQNTLLLFLRVLERGQILLLPQAKSFLEEAAHLEQSSKTSDVILPTNDIVYEKLIRSLQLIAEQFLNFIQAYQIDNLEALVKQLEIDMRSDDLDRPGERLEFIVRKRLNWAICIVEEHILLATFDELETWDGKLPSIDNNISDIDSLSISKIEREKHLEKKGKKGKNKEKKKSLKPSGALVPYNYFTKTIFKLPSLLDTIQELILEDRYTSAAMLLFIGRKPKISFDVLRQIPSEYAGELFSRLNISDAAFFIAYLFQEEKEKNILPTITSLLTYIYPEELQNSSQFSRTGQILLHLIKNNEKLKGSGEIVEKIIKYGLDPSNASKYLWDDMIYHTLLWQLYIYDKDKWFNNPDIYFETGELFTRPLNKIKKGFIYIVLNILFHFIIGLKENFDRIFFFCTNRMQKHQVQAQLPGFLEHHAYLIYFFLPFLLFTLFFKK